MPTIRVDWQPACRIIPTRFPTINLFDRVASPDDFDALYLVEAMTNDRLRDELGEIELVPRNERLFGPGSGPIMASFTHLNPLGSRFSDGSYGVFYAAREKRTAIAETIFHQTGFLRATNEDPIQLQMRLYHVKVAGLFQDVYGVDRTDPIYAPDSYSASRILAKKLRMEGAIGIHYASVRDSGGQCIAAFKTLPLSQCRHAGHMLYQWDGNAISAVFENI